MMVASFEGEGVNYFVVRTSEACLIDGVVVSNQSAIIRHDARGVVARNCMKLGNLSNLI